MGTVVGRAGQEKPHKAGQLVVPCKAGQWGVHHKVEEGRGRGVAAGRRLGRGRAAGGRSLAWAGK